jgi:hypothetical protein
MSAVHVDFDNPDDGNDDHRHDDHRHHHDRSHHDRRNDNDWDDDHDAGWQRVVRTGDFLYADTSGVHSEP